ncbi:MAG: NAD(+) synthase [Gemmatimonadaceae bacterium]
MTHTIRRPDSPITAALDAAAEIADACDFLRDYLRESGQAHFVIGLSGGIDSAVVAFLAVRAVGADRVLLVRMPYGLVGPSRFAASAAASLDDAQRVIDALPGVAAVTVNIAGKVDATVAEMESAALTLEAMSPAFPNRWTGITSPEHAPLLGNLKARARADVLRCLANQYRALICGTENATEHELGYFTIAGDEESDVEVLSPFLKMHVRVLAQELGVPQSILDKPPSADLWSGQTDEGEFGFSYAEADAVLWAARHHHGLGAAVARDELARASEVPSNVVHRIIDRHVATAYKRAPKPNYRSVRLERAVREPGGH